jgi:hypothetical protein
LLDVDGAGSNLTVFGSAVPKLDFAVCQVPICKSVIFEGLIKSLPDAEIDQKRSQKTLFARSARRTRPPEEDKSSRGGQVLLRRINLGAEPSSLAGAQVPTRASADIGEYACGLRPAEKYRSGGESRTAEILGLASISTENPHFEIASNKGIFKNA